jgi:hypothetical protein
MILSHLPVASSHLCSGSFCCEGLVLAPNSRKGGWVGLIEGLTITAILLALFAMLAVVALWYLG